MKSLRVDPLRQPLSRLALGTLGFSTATRARDHAVLDAWAEAGGTVIGPHSVEHLQTASARSTSSGREPG